MDREKSFSSVEKAQLSKLIDEDIFEKSTSISKKLEVTENKFKKKKKITSYAVSNSMNNFFISA